ncbi:MAG: tetratricopeptide repeat protein, partial [Nitrospina sp.]|nr:tetratricopeptide repeat protein [Nitrospina sp.]
MYGELMPIKIKLRQLTLFSALLGMTMLIMIAHATEAHSDEENGAYIKGKELIDSGDYRSAIPHLKEATQTNPSLPGAHYYLGIAHE